MRRTLFLLAAFAAACTPPIETPEARPPNIVFILADDLGYGELGSYGQTKIRTPRLDQLAAEGVRLTQHYAGSPVCAPSRFTTLTGRHTGHAYIRDNDEMNERGDVWRDPDLEGQRPMLDKTVTVGHVLREAGYVTGAIGKWGLGWVGSSGDPNRQGFDHFYGYICQRVAHNYYPTHLWRNGVKHELANEYFYPHQEVDEAPASYAPYAGVDYAVDFLTAEALDFIRSHRDEPFFLYVPYIVPHLALQVPEDSLEEYDGAFDETPYLGDDMYLPHPKPRAAYAAMITRMDRDIGTILDLLDELDLADDTVVVFSSDNGPSWVGGVDREFFDSTGGLRGRKAELREGGIRVPFIARWPGRIAPGTTSDHLSASWDLLPTFAEIAGIEPPTDIDGRAFVGALTGRHQPEPDYLYWEFQGAQAVRLGRFKAFRARSDAPIELYDLATDPEEQRDVSAAHADVAARARELLTSARTPSALFPLD